MTARTVLPGTGLDIGPLCLGGNVFGWTADRDASFAVLDAFRAAGGTMVDTADSYTWRVEGNTGGDSERILGEWLERRGERGRTVVATKVGSWPERPGLGAANVRAACEDSLRRLRTDHIDLYYAHRDDPDTPLEETLAALDELVRDGLVRHVGLSNYSAERLSSALTVAQRHGLTRPVAIQPHYNLIERAAYEDDLAEVVADADLGCLPYFALAKGFLTGKYRRPGERDGGCGGERSDGGCGGERSDGGCGGERSDGGCGGERSDTPPSWADTDSPMASARGAGAWAYLDARGERVLATLDELAAAHDVPVAAVALAWLAAQPTVVAPIASARSPAQLETLLPMAGLMLTDDELAALTAASQDTGLDA